MDKNFESRSLLQTPPMVLLQPFTCIITKVATFVLKLLQTITNFTSIFIDITIE
jgi:hypothetical protein